MSGFTKGISLLFSGPDTAAAEAAAKKQSEQQALALDKQRETLQNQDQETQAQLGAASRVPRGRRLLLAASGDAGLSSTLGGT